MGKRRRRWLTAAAAASVIVVGVLAGPGVARAWVHRSDPAAFHRYIGTYLGVADLHRLHVSPGSADAEAAKACAWLGTQPEPAVSVDPSGRFAQDSVLSRYLATAPDPTFALSKPGRSTVVAGAWTYLCWTSVKAHVAPRLVHQD